MNRAIARQSSPIVASREQACHAGGRGFESRRSRKIPAKKRIVLPGETRESSLITQNVRSKPDETAKRRQTRFEGQDFKPLAAASEPSANAACDHTNWPAVKAL